MAIDSSDSLSSVASTLFSLVNLMGIGAWGFLIFWASRSLESLARFERIAHGVVLVWSILYLIILVSQVSQIEGGYDRLDRAVLLFKSPWTVLAGWIHYLAFDLLIGIWGTRRALEQNTKSWKRVIAQLLTFILGPVGYLAFRASSKSQR